MLEEFKKFAMRGNVVDLAVAVVIGAAFGAVVNSLVADIIMPAIGAVTGGLDFSNYFLPLSSKVTAGALADAKKQGAVLAYGSFLTVAIHFLFVPFPFLSRPFAFFIAVKAIKKLKEEPPAAPPPPPSQEVQLLTEIRDALKKS